MSGSSLSTQSALLVSPSYSECKLFYTQNRFFLLRDHSNMPRLRGTLSPEMISYALDGQNPSGTKDTSKPIQPFLP